MLLGETHDLKKIILHFKIVRLIGFLFDLSSI